MNRDELLTRLAMELAEWPTSHQHIKPQGNGWRGYNNYAFPDSDGISRQEWLAERERLINKPSWDDAPEWADKLLQQDFGDWYWFVGNAQMRSDGWNIFGGCWAHASKGAIPAGHDWRETLEGRPVEIPADVETVGQLLDFLAGTDSDTRTNSPADMVKRQLIERCDKAEAERDYLDALRGKLLAERNLALIERDQARREKDALAAQLERFNELYRRATEEDAGWMTNSHVVKEYAAICRETPDTSLAHRIAHAAEQCGLPRLLRDYRAMVGLASITGPAKRERLEWAASVEMAIFGDEQKYVISATHGRKDND